MYQRDSKCRIIHAINRNEDEFYTFYLNLKFHNFVTLKLNVNSVFALSEHKPSLFKLQE